MQDPLGLLGPPESVICIDRNRLPRPFLPLEERDQRHPVRGRRDMGFVHDVGPGFRYPRQ